MFSQKLAMSISLLKTSQQKKKLYCKLKYSKPVLQFLRILRRNCYIYGFQKNRGDILVYLRYYRGYPAISGIEMKSKPGSKKYVNKKFFNKKQKLYLNTVVISNSELGLVSDSNTGGEVICTIW